MSFHLRAASAAVLIAFLFTAAVAAEGRRDATAGDGAMVVAQAIPFGKKNAEPADQGDNPDDKNGQKKKKKNTQQNGTGGGNGGEGAGEGPPPYGKQGKGQKGFRGEPGNQGPEGGTQSGKGGGQNGKPGNGGGSNGRLYWPYGKAPGGATPGAGKNYAAPEGGVNDKAKIKQKKKGPDQGGPDATTSEGAGGEPATKNGAPKFQGNKAGEKGLTGKNGTSGEGGGQAGPTGGAKGEDDSKQTDQGSAKPAGKTQSWPARGPQPFQRATKPPPKDETKEQRQVRHEKEFENLKSQRQEVVEDGGKRKVIIEPDKRRIFKESGRTAIRHDENERLRLLYSNTRTERRPGGLNVTIVIRPNAPQVFTEVDDNGYVLRRWRRYPDGREVILFDNRPYYSRFGYRRPTFFEAFVNIGPPVIVIPRDRYIVAYANAPDDLIYETLMAPPIEPLERGYALEEIRETRYLRERMRRLDLDIVHFDFGSWEVDPEEFPKLERLARVMNRILDRNGDEMFFIEGHTDAVGSEEDNLSLSDRRAESVAMVLSEEFGVPPENLTTQGYGEQFLKEDTQGPSAVNRVVVVRRITPLLAR